LQILCLFLAGAICGSGCSTYRDVQDPLQGWKRWKGPELSRLDDPVRNDIADYIARLSPGWRASLGGNDIDFSQDGEGHYAAKFHVEIEHWYQLGAKIQEHILIYDENKKRERVIKYISGWRVDI
jgi:hypothetical protein